MKKESDKDIDDFVVLSRKLASSFYGALVIFIHYFINFYFYFHLKFVFAFFLFPNKPNGVNFDVQLDPEMNLMPVLQLTNLSDPFINFLSWQRIMSVKKSSPSSFSFLFFPFPPFLKINQELRIQEDTQVSEKAIKTIILPKDKKSSK